jgi:hypothetical protein
MQRKESQNHDSLRKTLENIIIFRKTFSEHLKTIIKAGTQNKTVKYKGTVLTPKLSTDMVSSPQKLLFEAQPQGFLTQNAKKGF